MKKCCVETVCMKCAERNDYLASFPGSPLARTKNQKERGEPGRIYHVRNVIGRENLITCGQTNKLAHAVWTDTVIQL